MRGYDSRLSNETTRPSEILFFNGRVQPNSAIVKVLFSEIKAHLGFEYKADSLKDSIDSCRELCGVALSQLLILGNPENTLIVHTFSERIGKSLTTIEPIKKGTILLEYVGEQVPVQHCNDSIYSVYLGYSPSRTKNCFDAYNNANASSKPIVRINFVNVLLSGLADLDLQNGIFLSAKDKGNLARFVTHMPDINPHPNVKGIKLSNLDLEFLPSKDGHLRAFLVAKQDINAFEELGFDYGQSFVNSSKGQIIYLDSSTNDIHEISINPTRRVTNFASSLSLTSPALITSSATIPPMVAKGSTPYQVDLHERSTALQRNEVSESLKNFKIAAIIIGSAAILIAMLSSLVKFLSKNEQGYSK
jgi:hypothetical protein